MNSYINWVFNSSSQLALLPVPLMPMSMLEDKAMTGYRLVIFRKSFCIHIYKNQIFLPQNQLLKKGTSCSYICFSSAPMEFLNNKIIVGSKVRNLCFKFSLNPLRFSLTKETDTKLTRSRS